MSDGAVCVCPGSDVRLLLPGALHGKPLHHAGRRLPEIQEQRGQIQGPIGVEHWETPFMKDMHVKVLHIKSPKKTS